MIDTTSGGNLCIEKSSGEGESQQENKQTRTDSKEQSDEQAVSITNKIRMRASTEAATD